MRIVVFGEEQRVGAWEGETVIDLNRADPRIPARLSELIEAGQSALENARRAIELGKRGGVDGSTIFSLSAVKLHAPWPGRRIACAGANYAAHLQGMSGHGQSGDNSLEGITRASREQAQWGFWKVPEVAAGPEDVIPYPKRTHLFDYEGEAAIVLGKRGKDIPADQLSEYVWGVTLLNDWSIRDDALSVRPMSYNQAKNFDGSTSMGPCIVVDELDPSCVDVETRVNGDMRQRYNTGSMIWSFGEILENLSRDFTFIPGDVISGGTSAGTAMDKTPTRADGTRSLDLFLQPGDTVEVASARIGTLRNRIA